MKRMFKLLLNGFISTTHPTEQEVSFSLSAGHINRYKAKGIGKWVMDESLKNIRTFGELKI